MIRVAVAGVAGRMGRELVQALSAEPRACLAAGTVRAGTAAPVLGVPVETSLEAALDHGVDVVIDFTQHAAAPVHAAVCAARGVPLVLGTTGLSVEQQEAVNEASKRTPVLTAANTSLGVLLLSRFAEEAARVLGPAYDVELVEAHHRHKKDAPSGTALQLARAAAAGLGVSLEKDAVHGRHGLGDERPKGQIGIHAVRGGDVVGEHTILFLGDGERIELRHQVTSRQTFARGAVRAALWLVGRVPGLYSMKDVLT
jgi:4-hydroxy-tetrahydrodipicolinate reductase